MVNDQSQPTASQRWISRVHCWLGVGSVAFVLLLSVTGIALNHSSDLNLDRHYVRSPWLLAWYGVEVPAPQASFTVNAHRLSLIGERLYYDDRELADRIPALVGAVSTASFIAVATPTSVLLITPDGALVERIDTQIFLPGEIAAIGVAGAVLVLRSGDTLYETDEKLLTFLPCSESDVGEILWPAPSAIPEDQLAILQQLYRGRGLSLERLTVDLHSGRIFAQIGPLLLDAVGIIFIALSVLGLLTWLGRNGRSRPRS